MKDSKVWIERFRMEPEEFRLISKLATNQAKRDVFARLAQKPNWVVLPVGRRLRA